MKKKSLFLFLALVLALALALSACNNTNEANATEPPKDETKAPEPTEPEETEPPEPVSMFEDYDLSGVTIQLWHVYGEGDVHHETLLALVDEFNTTNEYGITVEQHDQGRTSELEEKINVSIVSGDYPNIAIAYISAIINWDVTAGVMVELNQFVYDPMYGFTEEELADIYPSVFNLGVTPDGRRLAWPYSQSVNAMVYNFTWAQELGFDSPPTSPEELKDQICAATEANATDDDPDNDGTGGIVWGPSASNFLAFLHAWGGSVLDADGNYDFNTPEALAVAKFVLELRDAGCTYTTESYANPEQATRRALITTSSSAGAKYYGYAFSDAENDDEWGFMAFPGPDGGKGVVSWTQNMGIFKATPEQELASWVFLKFLSNAANQATWVQVSAYLPTHFSTESMLVDYIDSNPVYETIMELSALGQGEPETYPAWASIRRALDDAAAEMYAAASEEELVAILADLTETAAELVEEITE